MIIARQIRLVIMLLLFILLHSCPKLIRASILKGVSMYAIIWIDQRVNNTQETSIRVQVASIFSQLLSLISRNDFAKSVRLHNAEKGAKTFPAGISSYPCYLASLQVQTAFGRSVAACHEGRRVRFFGAISLIKVRFNAIFIDYTLSETSTVFGEQVNTDEYDCICLLTERLSIVRQAPVVLHILNKYIFCALNTLFIIS
jgi:hypothetical protein